MKTQALNEDEMKETNGGMTIKPEVDPGMQDETYNPDQPMAPNTNPYNLDVNNGHVYDNPVK